MSEGLWLQFIQKARENYYKIGAVPCPAFNGQLVYFNNRGWNHITRKNGEIRSREQQKRRICLIPYAVDIVRTSVNWKEYRGNRNDTEFWSFSKRFGSKTIIVIVRKHSSRKYFFSIMDIQ